MVGTRPNVLIIKAIGGSEVKIILWLKLVVYRHTNKPEKKNFKKNNPGRFGGPICLKNYNKQTKRLKSKSVPSSKSYLLLQFLR